MTKNPFPNHLQLNKKGLLMPNHELRKVWDEIERSTHSGCDIPTVLHALATTQELVRENKAEALRRGDVTAEEIARTEKLLTMSWKSLMAIGWSVAKEQGDEAVAQFTLQVLQINNSRRVA